MEYLVIMTLDGFAIIKANSEEEAKNIAEDMPKEEFTFSNDVDISVEEYEN